MSRKADNNTLFAWVASIPGVGPKWFSILFAKFPDLQELLTISAESLQNAHIPEKLSRSIVEYREVHTPEDIEEFVTTENIQLLINPAHIHIGKERDPSLITQDDKKGYPSLLSEIPDPPVVLYLKGEMPDFSLPAIGVVGTRKITWYEQGWSLFLALCMALMRSRT
jgi:DNA processing protein